MTTQKDGDGGAASSDKGVDEPATRPSAMELLAEPSVYPDDGPLAAAVRKVDHYAGLFEQAALFAILIAVVLSGAIQAIASKAFDKSLLWTFDIVRGGTFAIALVGAAFASHQAKHLSMDVVSRFVSARKRLALRVVLGLFTIFAAYLLLRSGLRLHERVGAEAGHDSVIPMTTIAMMIPLGSGLIIFHTLLHLLIDVDYLRRGKLPPEKAMTGH